MEMMGDIERWKLDDSHGFRPGDALWSSAEEVLIREVEDDGWIVVERIQRGLTSDIQG